MPSLLEAAVAGGEEVDRRPAQIRETLLEARIDRRGLFQDHRRGVAVVGEEAKPAPEARPEQRFRVGDGLRGRFAGGRDGVRDSLVEVLDDGEEDLLFAVEVEVEGAARDAGARDDVADSRPAVPFACKDPGCGLKQLLAAFVGGQKGPALGHGLTID